MPSVIARLLHGTEQRMVTSRPGRRGFGAVRKLPPKRFRASYLGPDLDRQIALKTFGLASTPRGGWPASAGSSTPGEWLSPLAREARKRSAPTLQDSAPRGAPQPAGPG